MGLFGQLLLEVHGGNWKRNSKKNLPRKLEKTVPKVKKWRLGGRLGGLGSDLRKKNVLEAVVADLGQAREPQNGGKMGEDGVKMRPRWAKLEAQDGAWLAILRPLGESSWRFLGVLGVIFAKRA